MKQAKDFLKKLENSILQKKTKRKSVEKKLFIQLLSAKYEWSSAVPWSIKMLGLGPECFLTSSVAS